MRGTWNAPVAPMTSTASMVPPDVSTMKREASLAPSATVTRRTSVSSATGAPMTSAYRAVRATISSRVMNPFGSPASYGWPGRSVRRFGVTSWNASQRSCHPPPSVDRRSTTMWSRPACLRSRLISSPAWPAPMTTVCVEVGRVSGTRRGYVATTKGKASVDRRHHGDPTRPHLTDPGRDQRQGRRRASAS